MICLECKHEKQHEARGLCHTCYTRIKRNGKIDEFPKTGKKAGRTIAKCSRCHKLLPLEAKGMCRNCYASNNYHKNKHKKRLIICSFCGKKKPHRAKGMCGACYNRTWRNNGVPTKPRKRQPELKVCVDCEKLKIIHGQQRCKLCYGKWHRAANPELYKKYAKKQRAQPGQALRALNNKRKRRSRKKNLPATLTNDEWNEILVINKCACVYCGKANTSLEQEHWIPLSRGGGYTAKNIVPACRSCNSRKGTKTGDEFIALLKKEKDSK